jgi:putative endonuclease
MEQKNWFVYILKCSDGSYYTGITYDLENRLIQHDMESDPTSYLFKRRPFKLVYSSEFDAPHVAIAAEKQIKGWSRKKKEALIAENWDELHVLARNKRNREKHKNADPASTRASTSKDSSVASHRITN